MTDEADEAHGPIRVLVIDDHLFVSESVGMAIDLQDDLRCVGLATTAAAGLEMAAAEPPDVVLMDLRLPDMDGVDATAKLKETHPEARVIILTAFSDVESMARAAAAGASGFLQKESSLSQILDAIRQAGEGAMLLGGASLSALLSRLRADGPSAGSAAPVQLTPREREVLELMGQGLDARRLAKRLDLSIHTARDYIKSILAKLGAHSQLEAVVAAVRAGLISPPA